MIEINKNPGKQDLRKFGWAMLIGFGVLGAVVWLIAWRTGSIVKPLSWSGASAQVAAMVLWALGVTLWGLSTLTPAWGRAVYIVWMTVASIVGYVMTTVLLTLLFFLFLPPFSLIVRFGDPLRRKLKPDGSYWEDHKPHEPTLERMRRMF